MDDRSLLDTFTRSRDDAAFAAIVARYGSMVLATARRQTRDAHRADDVAQAAFLILARRASSVDGSLGAWLHRTTVLASRNANRVDARRRRHEREASVDRSRHATTRVDHDALIALDAALERLGRRDREVIALRFFESLDVAEIAARLGVNVEAAKKRLGRAMTRLRRHCCGDTAVALGAIVRPSDVPFDFHPTAASESIAKGTLATMKHALSLKVAVGTSVTLAVIAGVVVAQTSGAKPQAANTPATAPTTAPATRPLSPIEAAWNDLAEPEPRASIALLKLSDSPDAFIAFAQDKLLPLTLTADDLATLLVDLGSDDEMRWRSASARLRYFDPRLAADLVTLMSGVTEPPTRQRLVEVLVDRPAGELAGKSIDFELLKSRDSGVFELMTANGMGSFNATRRVSELNDTGYGSRKLRWTQVIRGMVLLEHIHTPVARAIVDAMATGHPDAQPTRVARDLIAARPKP